MHLPYTSLFLTCLSCAVPTIAQPLIFQNASSLQVQEPALHPPFRYFKLRDDSNSTITQVIGDSAANAIIWQQGPSITTGGFYWIDLADETGGQVVNGSSYRFGAAILGGPKKGFWSANAYAVDLGSDYEALFVYHDEQVTLDSVYVKSQDGKKD